MHTYQWLPSDIHIDGNGKAKILSYINGLNPDTNATLYAALEELVTTFLPMWNQCITTLTSPELQNTLHGPEHIEDFRSCLDLESLDPDSLFDPPSIEEYRRRKLEEQTNESQRKRKLHTMEENTNVDSGKSIEASNASYDDDDDDESDDESRREEREWKKSRIFIAPQVGKFTPPVTVKGDEETKLQDQTIQVIFKIASVELSPEKPQFEGGTWHVEGTDRENIISTAIHYLDSDNITVPSLSFRQSIGDSPFMDVGYHQDEHEPINRLFGSLFDGTHKAQSKIVNLGSVQTPAKRTIVFPNTMQHKLSPFELKDKSKPGYRRFIVMFLVDPHLRITSTAEVAPQMLLNERELASVFKVDSSQLSKQPPLIQNLPAELSQKVMKSYFSNSIESFEKVKRLVADKNTDDVVDQETPMTFGEACWHRDRLMEQRRYFNDEMVQDTENDEGWGLCEH